MTPERKALCMKIGVGVVITAIFVGYIIVWIHIVDVEAYQHAGLIHHNYLRARHGSDPLTINPDLCVMAMMCAKHYINIQKIDHSCPLRQNHLLFPAGTGENLWATGYDWSHFDSAVGGARVFYQEMETYNFSDMKSNHDNFLMVGHLTQMLWRETKQLCVAVARSPSSKMKMGNAIVYLYYPPGNLWSDDMAAVMLNVRHVLPGSPPIKIYGWWGHRGGNDTREAAAAENNFLLQHINFCHNGHCY